MGKPILLNPSCQKRHRLLVWDFQVLLCHLLKGLKSSHFLQLRGLLKGFMPLGEAQRIKDWDLLSYSPALSPFPSLCPVIPSQHAIVPITQDTLLPATPQDIG